MAKVSRNGGDDQQYIALTENSFDFIGVCALDGRVLYVNAAGLKMVGLEKREEATSLMVWEFHPEDQRLALKETVMGTAMRAGVWHGELVFQHFKTGARIHTDANAFVLKDAETGQVTSLAVASRDVTERKKDDLRLRQMEKMSAVGQLAAGVVHEINNPLSVILGFAEILRQRVGPNDPLFIPVENILRESARCRDFIQTLLAFSRSGSAAVKDPVDLNQAVEEAVVLVKARGKMNGVEVAQRLTGGLPKILANKNQLEQIVINLGNNAVDAMPKGGKLTIETSSETRDGAPWLTITVADTGPGIPPEIQARIFEPFFTTKDPGKGTGLGLSLINEIVQSLHGTIELESAPGAGTRFTVRLPVNRPAPAQ